MDEHELSAIPREARPFQGQPAGVVTRLAAATVDTLAVAAVMLVAYVGFAGLQFLLHPRTFTFPDARPFTSLVVGSVVLAAYLTVAWTTSGRTYGDLLLGLRVVDARVGRVGLPRAAARAALYVLVPIGLLWVALDPRSRSLQDMALHTAVVYDWQPRGVRSGGPAAPTRL